MKIRFSILNKLLLFIIFAVISGSQTVKAQAVYQPYDFQFYQKFSSDLYSTQTRIHSSIKPYFVDDSLLKRTY
ncbi:MAG: gliding motility protein RemB, partial [Mucilaginibacter sp.]